MCGGASEDMKPKTLGQAKNLMRRALADLIDRPPGEPEQRRLREYFEHRCAYCSAAAGLRDGHIDHAEPKGGNSVGNLLLACKICNGDEKREMHWEEFLQRKCSADRALYEQRWQRIRAWMDANPRPPKVNSPEVEVALQSAYAAIETFAKAYGEVRRAAAASSGRRSSTRAVRQERDGDTSSNSRT